MRIEAIRAVLMVMVLALVAGCSSKPDPNPEITTNPPAETDTDTGADDGTTGQVTEDDSDMDWRQQVQDVFFDYDKFDLRGDARSVLRANADYLKAHPSARVVLEGHTDERGTQEYNLALGQQRADAVMRYMMDLGVDATQLSTVSYGEEKPFDPGHNDGAWALNRRVHFNIR